MSKSKNQHWVPQFYLREFSTPETRQSNDPQVWIFSKNDADGIEKLTNVRNVCAKRYLYSPVDNCGQRSWDVDDKLEEVESLLARVWSQVGSDFVDFRDSALRKGMALFIATMHVRHPDNLQMVKSVHEKFVSSLDKVPKNSAGYPDVDTVLYQGKELEVDLSDWGSCSDVDRDGYHRLFTETIREQAGKLAEVLLKKRWSVVLADDECFITSDRPVAVQHPTRKVFGLGTEGVIVSLPLSPTRVLILDDEFEEPGDQYYMLKWENLGGFNYGIWHGGSRFLITGRSVPEVLSEIIGWSDAEGYS